MTDKEITKRIDHTLLKPEATEDQIRKLCCEALELNSASVCVNPRFVSLAVSVLDNKIPVCTVIGFPLGASTTASKVFEATDAINNGAAEIDMVISVGDVKFGNFDAVHDEISAIKKAIGDKILKVIIETCLLTDEEKRKLCRVVLKAGADYIKTSTGFSTGGATEHDISLFSEEIGGKLKIKASGGIRSREQMERFIKLGADRLGCSAGAKVFLNK